MIPQVIAFQIAGVFTSDSNPLENARSLRALLDCLVSLDIAYRMAHPKTPALYRSGVRYRRTVEWDQTPVLYARQYGDCKSLSATRIAELRCAGIACDPEFRWIPAPDRDGNNYHILVRRAPCAEAPQGVEDPSKVLGMGKNEFASLR